jgi:hypothetical protein
MASVLKARFFFIHAFDYIERVLRIRLKVH